MDYHIIPVDRKDEEGPIFGAEPEEMYGSWEDVVDDYGEPEALTDGVWVARASRDKPWHGVEYGDIVALIYRVG